MMEITGGRRKCACGCGQKATHTNGVTAWASYDCAIRIAEKRREKTQRTARTQQRREIRAAREKLKTWQDHRKDTKRACHEYIRLRDRNESCISCGASPEHGDSWAVGGGWDAGHYLSVAMRPELQFNEQNIHKQCKKCNGGAGRNSGKRHQVDTAYRANLEKRIGLAAVKCLELPRKASNFSIPDLNEIRDYYREKTKELKRGME